MDDQLTKLYALKTYGELGPRMLQSLLIRYGGLDELLAADVDELSGVPRLSVDRARRIADSRHRLADAEEDISLIKTAGIGMVNIFDADYPAALLRIDDPPPILFYQGQLPANGQKALAVVGTTKASENRIVASVSIGRALARRGIAVISGLAAGIDASAHLGSLKDGGYTVAVLGNGLLHIYPGENQGLAKMVEQTGCLISEFHPETRVSVGRLMSRNRLIVGLATAVIVVELSGKSSGTMNAMVRAREQGKGCFLYDPDRAIRQGEQSELSLTCFDSIEQFESMIDYMTLEEDLS